MAKHLQIRQGVFESNSSSTHSITLDLSYENKDIPDDAFIFIHAGKFGWEFKKFNDFYTKASYLWTISHAFSCQDENDWFSQKYPELSDKMKKLKTNLKVLEEQHNLGFLTPSESEYCYVDHGVDHWANMVNCYPQLDSPEGIWEFLTNCSYWVFLGNDNEEAPPGFKYTTNQCLSFDYYIKFEGVDGFYPLKDKNDKNEIENILLGAAHYMYMKKRYLYARPPDDIGRNLRWRVKDGVFEVDYGETEKNPATGEWDIKKIKKTISYKYSILESTKQP